MIQTSISPISSAQSFLVGTKPAVLENVAKIDPKQLRELERFPHFSLSDGFAMFFKTEDMMRNFEESVVGLEVKSKEYQIILGNVLGYPPLAVEFFAKKFSGELSKEEFMMRKVSLHFSGISCMGDVFDLRENVNWLLELLLSNLDMVLGDNDPCDFSDRHLPLHLEEKGSDFAETYFLIRTLVLVFSRFFGGANGYCLMGLFHTK
ncbi:hypothetical protein [Laceyella putida]|uniref:Uncharacterized protein n=1 Tax=Laceyella putida TaxID=110101 RepID=A0ABW2RL77_9BACL